MPLRWHIHKLWLHARLAVLLGAHGAVLWARDKLGGREREVRRIWRGDRPDGP